jgi:hypothetical protein
MTLLNSGKEKICIFDSTIPREIHLVAVGAKQASVNQPCGNVSQKPHLYTRLEWMLVRPISASGEFSRMQKLGSSFPSMKLDFCGEVVLVQLHGDRGVAGVPHGALHCEMLS